MEPVHGAHKVSKGALKDFISSMPDIVITNFLDRLPIQDAVKTSMLSRDWRSKWTLLTRLIFDDYFFRRLPKNFEVKHITRLLLHLKGPIRKFELSIMSKELDSKVLDYDEIYQWVLFLSRKGIEELTINNWGTGPLKIPTQLYSRMELKHLKLYNCRVSNLHSFRSFPNLLSLKLFNVTFQSCTFWEFIARCPLLEILKVDLETTNEMKLIEFSNLRNIKTLYLSFGCSDEAKTITSSNIFQLTCLPKLEKLTLNFECCKLLAEANAKKKVPAAFLCLKTLKLCGVGFRDNAIVSFIVEMISGSPNLQMLVMRASNRPCVIMPWERCSLDLDSNTMGPLQLQSVVFQPMVIEYFPSSENELSLIKLILAHSPLLKKISIRLLIWTDDDETTRIKYKWELARKLLKLHRASPIAEIDFLQ